MLSALLTITSGFHALAQETPETKIADPALWGPYAQLVGTQWGIGGSNRITWAWGPDDTIVESRPMMAKMVIRRGEKPGELVQVYGSGLHTYDGRVEADGSVLWIRRGRFLKMPGRVAIIDGRFREETLKINDANEVVRVIGTGWYDQTAGKPVTAMVAGAATVRPMVAPNATLAAAAVSAPPKAPFRGFERFVGKRLWSAEARNFIDFSHGADGTLVIEFSHSDEQTSGAYVLRESPKNPGQYEMLQNPDQNRHFRTVAWNSDDSLSLSSKNALMRGWFQNYDFVAEGDTLKVRSHGRLVSGLGVSTGEEYDHRNDYVVLGDAALAQMRAQRQMANEAYAKALAVAQANQPDPATLYAQRMAVLAELAKDTSSYEAELYAEQHGLPYTPPEDDAPKVSPAYQALLDLNAAASASEARSRAALDTTLEQAARQAAYERELAARREQEAARARRAEDARRAREATERQHEVARQYEAQQAQQRAQRASTAAATQPPRQAVATGGNDGSAANCAAVYKSGIGASGYAQTQADAERQARRFMELQCPGGGYSAGALQCGQKSQGDIVDVDSKGRSTKVGERTAWMCQADYRCTAPSNQCATLPGKGSAQ